MKKNETSPIGSRAPAQGVGFPGPGCSLTKRSAEHTPKNDIAAGVVHAVPLDLKRVLVADGEALALWEELTPLARNEWICWIEDAKREGTRLKRVERVRSDLKQGQRRPCCWPGCPHRP